MGTVKEKIVKTWRGRELDEIKSQRLQNASTSKTVLLRSNENVDESLDELCRTLTSNLRLQTLVISQVPSFGTDTGGKLLADLLKGNSTLKNLDLTSLNPTFECVDAFCKALELPETRLESLSFGDTELYISAHITQRLTRMLSTNKSIKHFSLSHISSENEDPADSSPWSPSEQSERNDNEQTELQEVTQTEQRRKIESEAGQGCTSLAEMLRQNQSLTSLSLSIYLGEAGPETIVEALEQNTTLEELHIQNILCWGRTGLTTLLKALTPSAPNGPKLRLKLLHLDNNNIERATTTTEGSTTLSANDLPNPEVLAEMLLHNQSLQTFLICHGYHEEDWESVIVPAIAYNSRLNLVQRFPDPYSHTPPKPTWALLLKFNCVRCCFKVATTLMGKKCTPAVDYEVLSGSGNCFGLGATYSRLRGCRRLLHMAGDLQCWSKYSSAGARWTVKTSNRTYVLSFEDYSS